MRAVKVYVQRDRKKKGSVIAIKHMNTPHEEWQSVPEGKAIEQDTHEVLWLHGGQGIPSWYDSEGIS